MEIKQDNNSKDKSIITISRNDLTAVALLYNFLANDKATVSINEVYNFYNYIEQCGYYSQQDSFEFVEYEETPNTMLEQSIGKEYVEYKALNIEYIMEHYQKLPEEIINKTLTKDALHLIGVIRKHLTIDSTSKNYHNHFDIHAMGEKQAMESVTDSLTRAGFNNIKITNVFYQGMQGDHLYSVTCNADKSLDTINIEKAKMKKKKN